MDAKLIEKAKAGYEDAFGQVVEPFRRELLVHCYRILGSPQDAEDAVQETLLAAWRGLGAFQGRASIRTWLYRVATNRCLNACARPAATLSWRPRWSSRLICPSRHGSPEAVWLEP